MNIQRAYHKVLSKTDIFDDDECWPCDATPSQRYPTLRIQDRTMSANRIVCAYRHERDVDDDSWIACHTCHNPRCVNPKHLYPGTDNTNAQDRVRAHRTTSKLSEEQARYILSRKNEYDHAKDIAERFFVSVDVVYEVWRGSSWGHLQREEA